MVGSFPVNGQKFPVQMRRELARKGMIMAGLFWQVRRGNAEANEISLYFPSRQGKCSNQSRSRARREIGMGWSVDGPDGGPFADGFSGLARAFLHAGARSLLVSNWSIASEATVELTTGFLSSLRQSPHVRRAEALQTSMLKMLDGDNDLYKHPGFWAPFVVVGD